MRDCLVAFCLALVACSTPATPARAGECVEYGVRYVVALEAGTTDPYFETAVDCFGSMPFQTARSGLVPSPPRSSRPGVRIPCVRGFLAAIEQLALSKWAQDRVNLQMLYRIAARWGVAEFKGRTCLKRFFPPIPRRAITGCARIWPSWVTAAPHQSCAASTCGLDPKRDKGGIDLAEDILSCLYHIPCDEAISVARELLEGEEDLHLQGRPADPASESIGSAPVILSSAQRTERP
jgi:hypothetical protein